VCGIITARAELDLTAGVRALAHRGPDSSGMVTVAGVTLGHTRLAVQDPRERSNQPYRDGPVTITYNGELFNTPTVRRAVEAAEPGRVWVTTGDTEVLAAALSVLGPAAALPLLDGMFAVVWADDRVPGVLLAARDRHGEVPLHVHGASPVLLASEVKAFHALGRPRGGKAVTDVTPGTWVEFAPAGATVHRYAALEIRRADVDLPTASRQLAAALALAVDRRVIADVPVCSLLSGGIDSAAIALELTRHHPDLTCYTARLDPRSRDLRCARETADWLGVRLVEVPVPPPSADDLTAVVRHIEMPHKAQVEIGWPCLALAAAMRADGFRVTYSGEGSDELWASYGFAYHALRTQDWHEYRRDLIAAQARKNFPRVNKSFMAHGVEARLPFLDPDVVTLALGLPVRAVQDGRSRPKAVLQDAYAGRLPTSVLTRPKLAFQDGMGVKARIAETLPDPGRYYRLEHARLYGGGGHA
jgi:asparagine synthase (glutamine-hydrolysing)